VDARGGSIGVGRHTCVHVLLDRTCARIAGLHRRGRLSAAVTPTVLENKAAKLFRAQM